MRQMTMKRTVGTLAIGLALTLAACGSDAESTAATATTRPEATTTTTTTTASDSSTAMADDTTSTTATASGDVTTVTEADSGTTIAVAAGDTVRIELENCATCGYEWRENVAPEGGVLELVGKELIEPDRTDGMVGGYETAVFTYRAIGSGSGAIDLGYFGPGGSREGDFALTVTVS